MKIRNFLFSFFCIFFFKEFITGTSMLNNFFMDREDAGWFLTFGRYISKISNEKFLLNKFFDCFEIKEIKSGENYINCKKNNIEELRKLFFGDLKKFNVNELFEIKKNNLNRSIFQFNLKKDFFMRNKIYLSKFIIDRIAKIEEQIKNSDNYLKFVSTFLINYFFIVVIENEKLFSNSSYRDEMGPAVFKFKGFVREFADIYGGLLGKALPVITFLASYELMHKKRFRDLGGKQKIMDNLLEYAKDKYK
jgi:hypothetical protein